MAPEDFLTVKEDMLKLMVAQVKENNVKNKAANEIEMNKKVEKNDEGTDSKNDDGPLPPNNALLLMTIARMTTPMNART